MDDSIKRWTAKRKTALVIEIIQGKTTVSEASRAFDPFRFAPMVVIQRLPPQSAKLPFIAQCAKDHWGRESDLSCVC
jgi:hypothetical protein